MLFYSLLVFYVLSASCSEQLSRRRRAWIIKSFTIEEGHPGPFPYKLGTINIVRDHGLYFDLLGEGVDEEPKGVLSIDKKSGDVYVNKPVDYEEKTELELELKVKKEDYSIDTELGVYISIVDINDNPPLFQNSLYEINVSEEKEQGSSLLRVLASDRDQRGTANSTFHYEIKSVSPNIPDTEFFIDSESGEISFQGCLNYEAAEMFTVMVEAKDHGEVVSLSSSTTVFIHVQDGNNHLPAISGQTGSRKVKEHETGTSPLRLHVTDNDSPNSPAQRARFSIHDDETGSFKIETDPHTNDGVLTVVKPLDFEDGAQRELLISVENELPYFSCKVKEKPSSGPWKVDVTKTDGAQPHSVKVVIEIEDVNDPPVFSETVKEVTLEENSPTGTWVERVTAVDPDSGHERDFVYKVGHDPAGWVTVDPQKGDITTVDILDRESPQVVDDVYTVILHAVDNGSPPMTGTTTLIIHVTDQNDNVPQLTENMLHICLSENTANITAFDGDKEHLGGPFTFELLGDVEGKWELSPSHGYTAHLVKEPGVYAGLHTVDVKVSDMQGESGVYSLSVTVCDCSVTPNCRIRQNTSANTALGAMGIMFASLFLLLILLLMAVTISCKKEFTPQQAGESSGETLLISNIEMPGTDCKVPENFSLLLTHIKDQDIRPSLPDGMWLTQVDAQQQNVFNRYQRQENLYLRRDVNQIQNTRSKIFNQRNLSYASDRAVSDLLHWRLSSVQEREGELADYQPHLYADEGDLDRLSELEDVIIPDQDSIQKILRDLGPKFNQLASICRKSEG